MDEEEFEIAIDDEPEHIDIIPLDDEPEPAPPNKPAKPPATTAGPGSTETKGKDDTTDSATRHPSPNPPQRKRMPSLSSSWISNLTRKTDGDVRAECQPVLAPMLKENNPLAASDLGLTVTGSNDWATPR